LYILHIKFMERLQVICDYKAAEVRAVCYMAKDATLLDRLLPGRNIHIETACSIFGVSPEEVTPDMKTAAKAVTFGVLYGRGPDSLAEALNITYEEAQNYISFSKCIPMSGNSLIGVNTGPRMVFL